MNIGKSLAWKKSGPIGIGGTERGLVRVEEQALEGNGPKWRPAVRQRYKGETAPYRSQEEEPWDGSDLTVLLQEVSPFFKPV
jgi:hypothetical protein